MQELAPIDRAILGAFGFVALLAGSFVLFLGFGGTAPLAVAAPAGALLAATGIAILVTAVTATSAAVGLSGDAEDRGDPQSLLGVERLSLVPYAITGLVGLVVIATNDSLNFAIRLGLLISTAILLLMVSTPIFSTLPERIRSDTPSSPSTDGGAT